MDTAPKLPDWYKANVITGDIVSDSANALLPQLSQSDMATTATWLAGQNEKYSPYKDVNFPVAPNVFTPSERANFLSKDRAQQALTALKNMQVASGKTAAQLGAGYDFLTRAVQLLDKYGGVAGAPMSRADFNAFTTVANNLLNQAKTDSNLANYGSIAQTFLFPGGASGLSNTHLSATGEKLSGKQNAELFG